MKKKLFTFKTIALALAIVIIYNLFINYGIVTFYDKPEYRDFCEEPLRKDLQDPDRCAEIGGEWIPFPAEERTTLHKGYCDNEEVYRTCNEQYENVLQPYERNVFIVLLIAGIVAITIGLLQTTVAAVSTGFLFGGVLSLFIGTVRYWSRMDDYLRFIILGLTLAFLVWLGYKKLKS